MGRKSFKVVCELRLQMICAPHSPMCAFDHVYVNVEMFGETRKSALAHPDFPISCDEPYWFEKVLWSPQTRDEVYKLLKESPVSVELRHLTIGSTVSKLAGYADSNAYEFLVIGAQHDNNTLSLDKHLDLKQTESNCGQPPKLKFKIRTTISHSATPVMDELLEQYSDSCIFCDIRNLKKNYRSCQGDVYSCDCELHKSKDKDMKHCKVCHQDRTVSICEKCHQQLKKYNEECRAKEITDFEEGKPDMNSEKFRPPFVVRKVTRDLVGRIPDAYDSQYNQIVREQTQRKSLRQKELRRLRSVSPPKSKSENRSSAIHQVCYGCLVPSAKESRINCDACNLTTRGELSNRNCDLIRPEPPSLRTYREPTDQRPIYTAKKMSCNKCQRSVSAAKSSQDESLCTSSRPVYLLDGYRDLAKYFPPAGGCRCCCLDRR